MKRAGISLALVALLCISMVPARSSHARAQSQAPAQAKRDSRTPALPTPQFAYGGDAAEIPAEFVGNLVFLPVRLNQSRSSFFLLDSTAAASSIDPSRLSALGISPAQAPMLNFNGVDLPFAALPALARPDLGSLTGRVYEGTLGGDFFQRLVVEIDYGRHTVRLYDPASYTYSGGGQAFPLAFSAGIPLVQAKFTELKGKYLEAGFVVGTANDSSTILFDRYAEAHRVRSSHWKTVLSVDPQLNVPTVASVGRLKGLQLGRYTSEDTLVTFSNSDLPGSNDPHIAGIIGAAMLSRFTVIFDYPHQKLILAPNSRFPSDDQEDKSGISVIAKGSALKTFEVVAVSPGSPGAKAGVQKGDVIAGIDEDAAADLTLAEIRDLFRQVGHKYNLVIDRNGQNKQITVEMKRLL
jgi:PDZ domain-containing protein